MSKSEILAELPRLKAEERTEVLERLCELQEQDLLAGVGPSEEEKKMLDEALAEFERDGDPGRPWREVLRDAGAWGTVIWRVTIRAAAAADLREAGAWYEGRREGLGEAFLLEVADAMRRLEEAPLRYPIYYRDFRRVLLDRFPYKLFYRVEGEAVIVFRILHAARNHTRELR